MVAETPPPAEAGAIVAVGQVQKASGSVVNQADIEQVKKLLTQTKAIGVILPPPDIRAIVDKTAQFVAKNGEGSGCWGTCRDRLAALAPGQQQPVGCCCSCPRAACRTVSPAQLPCAKSCDLLACCSSVGLRAPPAATAAARGNVSCRHGAACQTHSTCRPLQLDNTSSS